MSKPTYRTAQGKSISMDQVRLQNEHVIAVGNMKVNARGDVLGAGGVPVTTRQQGVAEYYSIHSPMAGANVPTIVPDELIEEFDQPTPEVIEPMAEIITTPAPRKGKSNG